MEMAVCALPGNGERDFIPLSSRLTDSEISDQSWRGENTKLMHLFTKADCYFALLEKHERRTM